MSATPDPIDTYLDELFARLRGSPTEVRRILSETEQHLREAAAETEARGVDPIAAQREAVERFGRPRDVAGEFRRSKGFLPTVPTLAGLLESLAFLAMIGFLSIALSAGVAVIFGKAFGKPFISGDAPGVTYTASRCADFREYHPEAKTCAGAATAHHYDEVVGYRLDAGILGVLSLIGFAIIRRANRRRYGRARALPDGFTTAIGTALFGLAAAGLLGLSSMSIAFGNSNGQGDFLSGGVVAFAIFIVFGVALLRTLRDRSSAIPPLETD